ncbi:similar to Golgi membrane protein (Coy1) [Plenodomus lingam JN3]|uniref:Protein CASP n=1 Tax=Leptosphaeria maculans (strain JN3 / isolate v23.1.3 / race Av1-4-5-6-7-8) TaxID=985895 RepID=E5A7U0_LEPMJ|nr:similar to Golgi membrane protein (Coy1) [Plenodomus lingam JN3]CBX99685.1 similar to Golgi membrane protein (Coy1) [Plenodomus lingam JN3]
MEGGVDVQERPTASGNNTVDIDGPHEEENKFQKAIGAWRNIDLTTLIPQLDTVASDIVAHQRDTLTQRKDLAQKTKDFRKLDDASKLNDFKGLLKSYQNFIDLISNQSKTVQAAFFQVYSPLSEAPDPYPLLDASVDSLVTAEEVVPKLTAENERLQNTVAKLTTQLDETEKSLEEERAARKAVEESRDAKIKEVEASWEAVLDEKRDNWVSKEKSLEEKVENQDRLLKELKASYEVSQRLGRGEEAEGDGGRGATAAELEIVSSELERASHRLAEVEARNEQLRLELAQSASAPAQQIAIEDDPAYLRLRSENSSLLRKLENARFEKDSERTRLETETRSLEREIKSLKSEKEALREKVQRWGDYENVKQELEVLKSIEFATGDDDDEATEIALSQNGTASKGKGETLEQLLLARNKKLSNELTVLRVSHQDLQSRLEALQEELSQANMDLEKSRALNETLEADLEKVQQEATNAFDPAMSVAGTYVSRFPQSSYGGGRRGRSSPTSSIISGFDSSSQAPTLASLRAGGSSEPMGAGSGILPMITAQRDRFKKRNAELEAEVQKSYQTISSLRSEINALQKDNLDLYEKTRYVSSYNSVNRTTASSANAYTANPNPSTVNIGATRPADARAAAAADHKYRAAYETSLSPFAAFRGRESARAIKRMHLFERIVLRITKFVLQSRTTRNAFAVYLLGIHVLVFYSLFAYETAGVGAGAAAAMAASQAGGPVPGVEDVGAVVRSVDGATVE